MLPLSTGTVPGVPLSSLPAPFEAGWPIAALAALIGLQRLYPVSRPQTQRWGAGLALLVALSASSGIRQAALPGASLLPPLLTLAALTALILSCRPPRTGHPADRRPTGLSPAGTTLWLAALLAWGLEQPVEDRGDGVTPPPDDLTLENLAGTSVEASAPMLAGALLWRSDCALCRAHLQALAARPEDRSAPHYLINQGESFLSVVRYLDRHHPGRFDDERVLLDPRQHWLALAGEPALPFEIERAVLQRDDARRR